MTSFLQNLGFVKENVCVYSLSAGDGWLLDYYCSYYECCNAKHIIYDIDGLKQDLQDKLYGQHIVNDMLIRILRKNLDKSEKPLVMSFHGNMGTGKNHVTDLIVKNFYKKGKNSQYVHRYRARKDFPIDSEAEVRKYRVSVNFTLFFQ